MKRFFLGISTVLAFTLSAFTARAGHGYCGGGGHGGGYYGGHGYYGWGGHGCYGWGFWPSFSFGIGFGGAYPSAGFSVSYPAYSYPVYGYGYAPAVYAQPTYVQPAYAYRVVQPYSPSAPVAVAVAPVSKPVPTRAASVYAKPASAPVVQKASGPAPHQPAVVMSTPSQQSSHTWVLDAHPYRYTPAQTAPPVTTYVVSR